MEPIATDRVGSSTPPLSPGVRAGDLVFVSGQVPLPGEDESVESGIRAETAKVLENLEDVLAEASLTLDNVVKTTVFLADTSDFEAMNEVYERHFSEPYPARSAIGVELAGDFTVEIQAIASTTGTR